MSHPNTSIHASAGRLMGPHGLSFYQLVEYPSYISDVPPFLHASGSPDFIFCSAVKFPASLRTVTTRLINVIEDTLRPSAYWGYHGYLLSPAATMVAAKFSFTARVVVSFFNWLGVCTRTSLERR